MSIADSHLTHFASSLPFYACIPHHRVDDMPYSCVEKFVSFGRAAAHCCCKHACSYALSEIGSINIFALCDATWLRLVPYYAAAR